MSGSLANGLSSGKATLSPLHAPLADVLIRNTHMPPEGPHLAAAEEMTETPNPNNKPHGRDVRQDSRKHPLGAVVLGIN